MTISESSGMRTHFSRQSGPLFRLKAQSQNSGCQGLKNKSQDHFFLEGIYKNLPHIFRPLGKMCSASSK